MNRILDIFYNYIIKEAQTGTIDCFLNFNMPFNTYIYEENKKYTCNFIGQHDLLIPTLIINNKEEFDKYLIEYTITALNFYKRNNFPEEILDNKMYNEKHICPEKMILTTLWANATVEDFQNPVNYLKRRIAFFQNKQENYNLGYVNILKGNLQIKILQDSILNETPNQIEITLNNNIDIFKFPKIKYGIENNKCYIYAMQNSKQEKNKYQKQINRILYQANEGLKDDYEEDNLKDVTPSFLVALNIAIEYLKTKGITEIIVPTCLITRWNAKSMAIIKKAKIKNLTSNEIENEIKTQNKIWVNINEKLIRTFRRLAYHNQKLEITSEPFLVSSNLLIKLNNSKIYNNKLLNETSLTISDNKEKKSNFIYKASKL